MDIELVEKQDSRKINTNRIISKYVIEDESNSKQIFLVCLLIKLILIYKCCLISQTQIKKYLEDEVSDSYIYFVNLSYCAIQIFLTSLPIIQLLFPHKIITNKLFNNLLGRFLYFFIFFIMSEKEWNRLMYPSVMYLIVWLIGNKVDENLRNELLY